MYLLDEIDGIQQVGFDCPWCRSAHVDAGNGAGLRENNCAAGRTFGSREMTDLHAGNVRNPFRCSQRHGRRLDGPERDACYRKGSAHASILLFSLEMAPVSVSRSER